MEPLKEKVFTKRQILSLDSVVFFAVFYLCVWRLVEPRLIYHAFGRIIVDSTPFLTGWGFLLECLTKIGGPIVYVNAFLSQCFYFSPIGAIIITAIAWLLWLACMRIFALIKAYCPSLLSYLYPALLLVGYASYHHYLLGAISALAAIAVVVLYIKADIKNLIGAVVLFLTAFAFLYYVGGGAAILFGLLVGFYELTIKGRKGFAALSWATTLAVYYISTKLFEIPIHIVQQIEIRDVGQHIRPLVICSLYAMCLLPFLILLEIAGYKHIVRSKAYSRKQRPAKRRPSNNSKALLFAKQVLSFIAPLILIGLSFSVSHAKRDKITLKSDYYSYNKQWQKVLEHHQKNSGKYYGTFLNHDINRALYHTGQLGNKMFSYKQSMEGLLLSTDEISGSLSLPKFAKMIYVLIELGHLGTAERLAFELMENANRYPVILEKLAIINLAKKQNETAKIFLSALSQSDSSYSADAFFHSLLQKNSKNKMAFEYMMSFYLLTGQLNKFAKNIDRLNDFQYDKIPQHYQEALAVYASASGNKKVFQSYLSPQTVQIDKHFTTAYISLRNRKISHLAAKDAMRDEFGDTFMFYNVFEMPRAKK
jgi:hypothetical protein